MTFSMLYAFTENFVLPLSHDEVVHGKGSLLNKMPGDLWQQFANLRLLYGVFATRIRARNCCSWAGSSGQRSEWNRMTGPGMGLAAISRASRIAAAGGRSECALPARAGAAPSGFDWQGFEWIDCNDADASILSFIRRAKDRADALLVVANFTPELHEKYRVGVPEPGWYRELFNSDAEIYGGNAISEISAE